MFERRPHYIVQAIVEEEEQKFEQVSAISMKGDRVGRSGRVRGLSGPSGPSEGEGARPLFLICVLRECQDNKWASARLGGGVVWGLLS